MAKISDFPTWFDRNPKVVFKDYGGVNKDPHTTTTRWEYTVPPERQAFLELAFCRVIRTVAPTTSGRVTDWIYYVHAPLFSGYLVDVQFENASVDTCRFMGIGHSLILLEGDLLKGQSSDASVGGQCDHMIAAKLTEFDAVGKIDRELILEKPKFDLQEPTIKNISQRIINEINKLLG